MRAAFDRLNANPFIRYLSQYEPDVAICTHFLPSGIISSLKGEGKVKVLNTVVVTDLDIALQCGFAVMSSSTSLASKRPRFI